MSFIVVMDMPGGPRRRDWNGPAPTMYLCEPESWSATPWSSYAANVRRFVSVADAVACIVEHDLDHMVTGPLRVVDMQSHLDHLRSR